MIKCILQSKISDIRVYVNDNTLSVIRSAIKIEVNDIRTGIKSAIVFRIDIVEVWRWCEFKAGIKILVVHFH
jgi:hypothetical protein